MKLAEKQLGKPVFKGDPIEILDPGIPRAKKILEEEGLPVTDENIFIVGALATKVGNKGLDFLKGSKPVNVRKVSKDADQAISVSTTEQAKPVSSGQPSD